MSRGSGVIGVRRTHYKGRVVLAAHGLVQGGDAVLRPEIQMRASVLEHFDEVRASLQLCRQR